MTHQRLAQLGKGLLPVMFPTKDLKIAEFGFSSPSHGRFVVDLKGKA
jgi:hypothetical protein